MTTDPQNGHSQEIEPAWKRTMRAGKRASWANVITDPAEAAQFFDFIARLEAADIDLVFHHKTSGRMTRPGGGFVLSLTPDLSEQMVEYVRRGMPVQFAAKKCRVSPATVQNWYEYGLDHPDEDDIRVEFAADLFEAQADFVLKCMDSIVETGTGDAKQWTALMTALERLHPEFFSRKDMRSSNLNVNIAVGVVEKKLHELHAAGELVYDGG